MGLECWERSDKFVPNLVARCQWWWVKSALYAFARENQSVMVSECLVSCPDPTWEERVWWHSTDPLGFLLSAENFPNANHNMENTICGCNTGNPWALQHNDTAQWHSFFFLQCKLVISSQPCIQQLMNPGYDSIIYGSFNSLHAEITLPLTI